MGVIDVNDGQQIQALAEASGLSVQDVRDVVELCHGDEFDVRNYLQNLVNNRAVNRRALRA